IAGCAQVVVGHHSSLFLIDIPGVTADPVDARIVDVSNVRPEAIVLHIINPLGSQVDYGRIWTRLNGDSSTFAQKVTSGLAGKLVRLDLKLRPGIRLVPGINTVEITALDRNGRKFYRNFLVRTHQANQNPHFRYEYEVASGASPNDLPPEIQIS